MVLLVLFILVCVLWTKPHSLEAYQNGALPLNGYFHEAESFLFFFFSLNYLGSMPSMLVGAPFESSSMLCTYPRTTKSSKQSTLGTQKPITHSSLNHSPLFFLHLSELPLRCGHRCRYYGSLHSPVKVKLLFMLFGLLVWLYCFSWDFSSICGFLWSVCVQCLCVFFFLVCFPWHYKSRFLDPSCNTIVSLPTSVVFGYMCEFTFHFSCGHA